MATYTWDGGGDGLTWDDADNWVSSLKPADDTTGTDTINFPDGTTVDLVGVDQSGFANGIGTIVPAGDLTITSSGTAYMKFRTDQQIQSPSGAGECLLKIGNDLNDGLDTAYTVTFEIDPTTQAENCWLYQASVISNATTDPVLRAELYDGYGWQKRWCRMTAVTWVSGNTYTFTVDEIPAILEVGHRCQFVPYVNAIFDCTIASIDTGASTITVNENMSGVLINQSFADNNIIAVGGGYLIDVTSNIIITGPSAGANDNGRVSAGLTGSVLCCEIRGFNYAFESGTETHAHETHFYGVAHNIAQIFWENGSQCVFAGTIVGGGKSLSATTGRLATVINSQKGHTFGLDKDKSGFFNFRNLNGKARGDITSEISGSGSRSIAGTFAVCNDLIQTDNSASLSNFQSDRGLERMYCGEMKIVNSDPQFAVENSRRVFKTGFPDYIRSLDVYYSWPIFHPVIDEPDAFVRIDELTFQYARDTNSDLRDVIDMSEKNYQLYASQNSGVRVKNASILLAATGTPTLYDYWLEKGIHMGRVTKGVTGTPLSGIPSGMTNPSKFEFFSGTPDLFEEAEVYLTAGQQMTVTWDVQLTDQLEVPPFLYIVPWEYRSDIWNIDRVNVLNTQPRDGYAGQQAANTTGSTQNFSHTYTATKTGLHQVGIHAFAALNTLTFSATKTAWVDNFTATAASSGGGSTEGLLDQNLLIDENALIKAG